jgi:hypothetical protein
MQGFSNKPRKTNKLGVLGVSPVGNKFKAQLRCVHLGTFDTIEQAVKARNTANPELIRKKSLKLKEARITRELNL